MPLEELWQYLPELKMAQQCHTPVRVQPSMWGLTSSPLCFPGSFSPFRSSDCLSVGGPLHPPTLGISLQNVGFMGARTVSVPQGACLTTAQWLLVEGMLPAFRAWNSVQEGSYLSPSCVIRSA
jgi:hypothetical protein